MPRPSFNLQAIAADTETVQDDTWMISYIDVFVLMTTIFVMLLVLTRADPDKDLADKSVANVVSSELINLTGENDMPNELQQLVNSAAAESGKGLDHKWLDNIKNSIEQHKLNEHVQLQELDEFTSLEIQSRVLFKSGASELSRSGEALLEKLVQVLKSSEGLVFIEGHTDDRPIMSNEFPSNWDLASARATEVLQFFVAEGLSKKRFRAVSYGDTQPLVPNDSEANRSKNRRVSLMIQGPR